MFSSPFIRLDLRRLILLLTIASVLVTLTNSFYSIYKVQKSLLMEKTMEANRVYAEKMAATTDVFIESAQSQLEYSANVLKAHMHDESFLMREAERLRTQTRTFNSVAVVNAEGVIIAVSPETLDVKGVQLTSKDSLQSLHAQQPLVTEPFVSPAGNYLISISHPIFSDQGVYQGYVSGTIYLERDNILYRILEKHGYKDRSYVYVVDRNKTLIFHPDKSRIGESIANNAAIDSVSEGELGVKDIVNSKGVDMLTGFAPVQTTHWGIVAQRPKAAVMAELDKQMQDVFVVTIPIGLLTLLVIWVSAIFISRPLWHLARRVTAIEHSDTMREINQIHSWYFEVANLKSAILRGFGKLSHQLDKLHADSHSDAMTGLLNRRGMLKALDALTVKNVPLSVLALDIDYFKRVNDSYGHDVGDELIIAIAEQMQKQARQEDILCRAGGEEFLIFLANTDINNAYEVAERIRSAIEDHDFATVGRITVSIGVAYWPAGDVRMEASLKQADIALYQAKHQGRNRTQVAQTD
ncbi:sensor domain-containing diguanylate cyclase [Vibrio proteolyticus]